MDEICEFNVNAQCIKNGKISFLGTKLNEFQEMLLFLCKDEEDIDYLLNNITCDNKNIDIETVKNYLKKYEEYSKAKVIFIHSPTGTGKTTGMLLPTLLSNPGKFSGRIKTIITEPTNAIISEIYNDIKGLSQSSQNYNNLSFTKMTGRDEKKDRLWGIPEILEKNDLIVTNIDIISLYISGYYLINTHINKEKIPSWNSIFKKVKLFIIDEYHAYDEGSLAKVISLILISKATNSDIKFIFTSATPNKKIIEIIKNYNIDFKVKDVKTEPCREDSRKFMGNLRLIFTKQPLINEIPNLNSDKKIMYMFDHKIDAEKFIYNLKKKGINPAQYTGFNTRAEKTDEDINKNIIVATNAAELGVNINPDIAHIEPGRYYENFWQRLGRTGRGKNGIIYVHVSNEQFISVSSIENKSWDYNQLINLLVNKISLTTRTFNAKRLKLNAKAFIYAVYRKSNKYLQSQLIKLYYSLIKEYINIESLANNFFKEKEDEGDKNGKILRNWLDEFFINLGYFRGITTSIKIILPDGKKTTDDYIYCKMHYEMKKDGDFFRVCSFLDKPNKVNIIYNGLYGYITLNDKDLYNPCKFAEKFKCNVNNFFYDYSNFKELEDKIISVICNHDLLSKSLFIPKEVSIENDDNIFL